MEELRLMLDPNFCNDSVRDFLSRADLEKNPVQRIVAWLVSLGEFRPQETTFEEYLYNIEHDYSYLLNSYWGDESTHLSDLLDPDTKQQIKIHMGAKLVWFLERCREQRITSALENEAINIAHKIIPLILLFDSTLVFFPTDAYLFYTVLLAVFAYASESEISQLQAESLVFFLFRAVKYITNEPNKTTDSEFCDGRMREILLKISMQNAELSDILYTNRDLFIFTRCWESTLFSCCHDSSETFVIWDYLFLEMIDVLHRVICMVAAHIVNCEEIIKSNEQYLPIIEERNSWDVSELTVLADSLYTELNVIDPIFLVVSFGTAVAAALVALGSFAFRKK